MNLQPSSKPYKKELVQSTFDPHSGEVYQDVEGIHGTPGLWYADDARQGTQRRPVNPARGYSFSGTSNLIVNTNTTPNFIGKPTRYEIDITLKKLSGNTDEMLYRFYTGSQSLWFRFRPSNQIAVYEGGTPITFSFNWESLIGTIMNIKVVHYDSIFFLIINGVSLSSNLSLISGSSGDSLLGSYQVAAGSYNKLTGIIYEAKLNELDDKGNFIQNILFYKCDEGAGTMAYDSSGNQNHGIITNATLSTFHATDISGKVKSWQNEVGYSNYKYFNTNSFLYFNNPNNYESTGGNRPYISMMVVPLVTGNIWNLSNGSSHYLQVEADGNLRYNSGGEPNSLYGTNFVFGRKYHLAVYFASLRNDQIRVYVNSQLISAISGAGAGASPIVSNVQWRFGNGATAIIWNIKVGHTPGGGTGSDLPVQTREDLKSTEISPSTVYAWYNSPYFDPNETIVKNKIFNEIPNALLTSFTGIPVPRDESNPDKDVVEEKLQYNLPVRLPFQITGQSVGNFNGSSYVSVATPGINTVNNDLTTRYISITIKINGNGYIGYCDGSEAFAMIIGSTNIQIWRGASSSWITFGNTTSIFTLLKDGNWHKLELLHTIGSNLCTVKIDGNVVATFNRDFDLFRPAPGNIISIGGRGASNYLNCQISEYLYKTVEGGSTQLHFIFSENSGRVVHDISGKNYNGSWVNHSEPLQWSTSPFATPTNFLEGYGSHYKRRAGQFLNPVEFNVSGSVSGDRFIFDNQIFPILRYNPHFDSRYALEFSLNAISFSYVHFMTQRTLGLRKSNGVWEVMSSLNIPKSTTDLYSKFRVFNNHNQIIYLRNFTGEVVLLDEYYNSNIPIKAPVLNTLNPIITKGFNHHRSLNNSEIKLQPNPFNAPELIEANNWNNTIELGYADVVENNPVFVDSSKEDRKSKIMVYDKVDFEKNQLDIKLNYVKSRNFKEALNDANVWAEFGDLDSVTVNSSNIITSVKNKGSLDGQFTMFNNPIWENGAFFKTAANKYMRLALSNMTPPFTLIGVYHSIDEEHFFYCGAGANRFEPRLHSSTKDGNHFGSGMNNVNFFMPLKSQKHVFALQERHNPNGFKVYGNGILVENLQNGSTTGSLTTFSLGEGIVGMNFPQGQGYYFEVGFYRGSLPDSLVIEKSLQLKEKYNL